jgi:TusA-related sulfurtransferase
MVAARLPELPLGQWLEDPQANCGPIAAFCENAKSGPLPSGLSAEIPDVLDLRGVVCPGNAVRSRLVMAGYPLGKTLEILLDEGSPVENVPGALVADGCRIVSREKKQNYWSISVVKPADRK